MKFSKNQKKIIKLIADGKVNDITSCMRICGFTQKVELNKSSIEKEIKRSDLWKEYKVLRNDFTLFSNEKSKKGFIKLTSICEDDYTYEYPVLDYNSFLKQVDAANKTYEVDFTEPRIISKNMDIIYDLVLVWKYLIDNSLILEVEKEVSADDISIFYTLKRKKCVFTIEGILRDDQYYRNTPRIDAEKVISNNLEFMTDYGLICESKINKKIVATPELDLFIKKGFKTREDLFNRHTVIVAWLAIIISVIFSSCSVFLSYLSYKDSIANNHKVNTITIESNNTSGE